MAESESDPRVADFLQRNKQYAETTHKPIRTLDSMRDEPKIPVLAIISCWDTRIQPAEFFQFTKPGEAFILANAGGRADADALRTLIVLDNFIGLKTVMVVHHKDCGLTHITDEKIQAQLKEKHPEKETEIEGLNGWFGEIKDMEQSVKDDVAVVQASSFLKHVTVRGFVYDIEKGVVEEVQ